MSQLQIVPVEEADIPLLASLIREARLENPLTQARLAHFNGDRAAELAQVNATMALKFKHRTNNWIKAIAPDSTILGFAVWTDPAAPPARQRSAEDELEFRTALRDLDVGGDETLMRSMSKQHDEAEAKVEGKHWYLDNIAVAKSAQGQGVGSQLLEWGTRRADEAGLPVFCLSSDEGYLLYSRRGFEILQPVEFVTGKGDKIKERALLRAPRPVS